MSPTRLSKMEAAMRVVLAFNEAFNRHDVAGMLKLMSDDCIFECATPAPDGVVHKGREAITQFWDDFFYKSPYAHMEIEEIFGMGMHCIMRWRYEWGDADVEKEHIRGVDIFQVRDGLIREQLSYVKG